MFIYQQVVHYKLDSDAKRLVAEEYWRISKSTDQFVFFPRKAFNQIFKF